MKHHRLILTAGERLASVEGRKTQMRRVVNPQPPEWANHAELLCDGMAYEFWEEDLYRDGGKLFPKNMMGVEPPYQVGGLLYMLEPYRAIIHQTQAHKKYAYGEHLIEYVDTGDTIKCPDELDEWFWKRWRKASSTTISPCSMYKSLARHWFEVTEVRCERLQDISEEDIVSEGFSTGFHTQDDGSIKCPTHDFIRLWDSTHPNPEHKWAKNPFVFPFTYKKTERPI